MRTAALLIILALPAVLRAESDQAGSPPLDPLPRTAPVLPSVEDPAKLPPEQALQRRLADLVRARDTRIAEILRQHNGARPAAGTGEDPRLDAPRSERDKAWEALRGALASYLDKAPPSRRDPLEAARPRAQEAQVPPLAALNRLAVAECYRDLVSSPDGKPEDLVAGAQVLADLAPDDLAPADRPRALYLGTWFAAERARRAKGPEAAHLAAQARASQAELARLQSGSELVAAAAALLSGLPEAAAEPAP